MVSFLKSGHIYVSIYAQIYAVSFIKYIAIGGIESFLSQLLKDN